MAINIALTVMEPSGVARTNCPITSGVPLASTEAIYDTSELELSYSGSVIPCQFTVLKRHGGLVTDITKPIHWVLLDFQASMSASQIQTFYLTGEGVAPVTTPAPAAPQHLRLVV